MIGVSFTPLKYSTFPKWPNTPFSIKKYSSCWRWMICGPKFGSDTLYIWKMLTSSGLFNEICTSPVVIITIITFRANTKQNKFKQIVNIKSLINIREGKWKQNYPIVRFWGGICVVCGSQSVVFTSAATAVFFFKQLQSTRPSSDSTTTFRLINHLAADAVHQCFPDAVVSVPYCRQPFHRSCCCYCSPLWIQRCHWYCRLPYDCCCRVSSRDSREGEGKNREFDVVWIRLYFIYTPFSPTVGANSVAGYFSFRSQWLQMRNRESFVLHSRSDVAIKPYFNGIWRRYLRFLPCSVGVSSVGR